MLEDGDILSIDCGAIIEGWHADAAITVPVGEIDDESQRLIEVTRASLEAAIEQVVDGNRLGDVGAAVEGVAERGRVLGRAGVRRPRHRHRHARGARRSRTTGRPGRGLQLKEGMVLAIEPMVNAGQARDRAPRRRLDRRHRRRPPLRPLRAHHRRHRPRPRGPDPALVTRSWQPVHGQAVAELRILRVPGVG